MKGKSLWKKESYKRRGIRSPALPTHRPDTGKSSSGLRSHCESFDIDVPIALRKGIGSCTKHPLYSNFSSWLAEFTSQSSAVENSEKCSRGSKSSKVEFSCS